MILLPKVEKNVMINYLKRSSSLPPRVIMFLWRCIYDIIPTKVKIGKRLPWFDKYCVFCKEFNEDLDHLLL